MRKITAIVFAFLCALLLTPRVLADCTLPAGLESIEAQAFYEDLSLKGTLEIPEGVVSIGDEAFLGCTGLTGLVIPPSVTSIGDRAFYGCGNLSGVIYLNSGVSYAASSFTGTKLVLGVKVTGVSLQDTPAFITPGGTARIAATVLPENATIKDLIWESSDTSVLTVSGDGEVTGVAPGQATVTATAADGCGASAFCRVTVLPQLEIISITEDMAVRPGNSITLEAVPAGGTGSYTFRWYYCPDEFSAGVGTYTGNRISLIVGEAGECHCRRRMDRIQRQRLADRGPDRRQRQRFRHPHRVPEYLGSAAARQRYIYLRKRFGCAYRLADERWPDGHA